MHRSVTTPRHRWLGLVSTALLLCSLLGIGPVAGPAAGDPIAEKRAEAARIARELEAQGTRVSILAERLNQARLEAERLERQVRTATTELEAADREVAAVRARLRDRAVASYIGGRPMPMEQMLASGSANDVAVRATYVESVVGEERAMATTLDRAREQQQAYRADLDAARTAARAVLDDVADQRRAAAEAAAARRATLARVQGELGELVEAERVRRAEEEARRVQAELAARRERAAREEAARAAAAARETQEAARRAATTLRLAVPPIAGAPADESGGSPARGAEAAVAEARRQLGKPYEWGSPGPDSFDCSGLTSWAWRAGGRSLPHSSVAQFGATRRVELEDIQPGDLLFFGSPIHHVAIYAGNGTMIEASETGTPVRTASIYRRDLAGVGRVG